MNKEDWEKLSKDEILGILAGNDEEISVDGYDLQNITELYGDDFDFICECAKIDKRILAFINEYKIYNDRECALKLIDIDAKCIRFFDDNIRNDEEIARKVGQKDYRYLAYLDDKYNSDNFLDSLELSESQIEDFHSYKQNVEEMKGKYVLTPQKFDTYAKLAISDGRNNPMLQPTMRDGNVAFPKLFDGWDEIYDMDEYEILIVYSKDKSMEENLECIHNYYRYTADAYQDLNFLEYHERDLKECIGERNYAKELVEVENRFYDKEVTPEEFEVEVDKRVLLNRIVEECYLEFDKSSHDEKGNDLPNFSEIQEEYNNIMNTLYEEFETENYETLISKYSVGWKKPNSQETVIDEITELMEEKADLEKQQAIKEGRINVKG